MTYKNQKNSNFVLYISKDKSTHRRVSNKSSVVRVPSKSLHRDPRPISPRRQHLRTIDHPKRRTIESASESESESYTYTSLSSSSSSTEAEPYPKSYIKSLTSPKQYSILQMLSRSHCRIRSSYKNGDNGNDYDGDLANGNGLDSHNGHLSNRYVPRLANVSNDTSDLDIIEYGNLQSRGRRSMSRQCVEHPNTHTTTSTSDTRRFQPPPWNDMSTMRSVRERDATATITSTRTNGETPDEDWVVVRRTRRVRFRL